MIGIRTNFRANSEAGEKNRWGQQADRINRRKNLGGEEEGAREQVKGDNKGSPPSRP